LNGVFHVWPYWREMVQNTLARMGLPPLILPVFRVGDQYGRELSPKQDEDQKPTADGSASERQS
jgi:preprotein translocase subunit SecB